MIFWIVNCSIAFLICVFCAGIIIPQILLIAFRKRLFDLPDERKIHHCAVPRLGGIAFKPVVFFTVALLLGINMVMGHSEMLSEIENDVRPLAFAFCSIMVLYLVGMADDLIGIRYRAKFVIQILCGMMLIAGGIFRYPVRHSRHSFGSIMAGVSSDHSVRGLHHQCHQPDRWH